MRIKATIYGVPPVPIDLDMEEISRVRQHEEVVITSLTDAYDLGYTLETTMVLKPLTPSTSKKYKKRSHEWDMKVVRLPRDVCRLQIGDLFRIDKENLFFTEDGHPVKKARGLVLDSMVLYHGPENPLPRVRKAKTFKLVKFYCPCLSKVVCVSSSPNTGYRTYIHAIPASARYFSVNYFMSSKLGDW